jgi:hypothetical protein
MGDYAGAFGSTYPVGRLNDIVYPVWGGMEDWAYAGSWENAFYPNSIQTCTPTTYGGYPADRTSSYPDAALRAFNILVETADQKEPRDNTLGGAEGVLKAASGNGAGNGHVSRNMRLALVIADAVEPYVQWTHIPSGASIDHNHRSLHIDHVVEKTAPYSDADMYFGDKKEKKKGHKFCTVDVPVNLVLDCSTKTFSPESSFDLEFGWEVGGAFTVDETQVEYGQWRDLNRGGAATAEQRNHLNINANTNLDSSTGNALDQLIPVNASGRGVGKSPVQKGITRWDDILASKRDLHADAYKTHFNATVPIAEMVECGAVTGDNPYLPPSNIGLCAMY